LRRRGFGPEQIAALKQVYRTLYRSGLGLDEAREKLQARLAALRADSPLESLLSRDLGCMVSFLANVTRSIVR